MDADVVRRVDSGNAADVLDVWRARPVLELVRDMEPVLTAADAATAAAATSCLWKACLKSHHPMVRARGDVGGDDAAVVLKFLAERSQHFAVADAAFAGIAALCSTYGKTLSADVVGALCSEWLPSARVQSQSLPGRTSIFKALEVLSTLDGCAASGAAFVSAFVEAVSEERDPANVLVAFRINKNVTATFPREALAFHVSDLFDVLSMYFPVLFTPPPSCPVTRDQLRVALHEAMTTEPLHETCLPFVASKLASPSNMTKLDCLETMDALFACSTEADQSNLSDALTALRADVLRVTGVGEASDAALLGKLLQTLRAAARTTSKCPPDVILGQLGPIVNAAVSTMETDTPSGRAYATMLHAIASAGSSVCAAVFGYVVPLACGIYNEQPTRPRRQENVVAVVSALAAAVERTFAAGEPVPAVAGIAEAAQLFEALLDSSTDFVLCSAIEGWATLSAVGVYAVAWRDPEERKRGYSRIAAVLRDSMSENVARCAAGALANASRVDTLAASTASASLKSADVSRTIALAHALAVTRAAACCTAALQLLDDIASHLTAEDFAWLGIAVAECSKSDELLGRVVSVLSGDCAASPRKLDVMMRAFDRMGEAAAGEFVATRATLPVSVGTVALIATAPKSVAGALPHDVGSAVRELACELAERGEAIPTLGLLICNGDAAWRHDLTAMVSSRADGTPAAISQVLKAALCAGDADTAQRQITSLAAAVLAGDDATATALGLVLQAPAPRHPVFLWQQKFLHLMVAELKASAVPAATHALLTITREAQPSHIAHCVGDLSAAAARMLKPPSDEHAALLLARLLEAAPTDTVDAIVGNVQVLRDAATTAVTSTAMAARAACLALLTAVAKHAGLEDDDGVQTRLQLLSVRDAVVAAVRPALDDPKRIVRQAAAQCRHYWMLLKK